MAGTAYASYPDTLKEKRKAKGTQKKSKIKNEINLRVKIKTKQTKRKGYTPYEVYRETEHHQ